MFYIWRQDSHLARSQGSWQEWNQFHLLLKIIGPAQRRNHAPAKVQYIQVGKYQDAKRMYKFLHSHFTPSSKLH